MTQERPPCWDDGSCPTPIRCYLRGCQREPIPYPCPICGGPTRTDEASLLIACDRCKRVVGWIGNPNAVP